MSKNIPINKTGFLIFIVLFEFSVYVANDMILPALAMVFSDFKADSKLIPLCLGFFWGGAASIQLFCGPLSDHLGRRRTIIVGGVIILIGNAIGIFSFNVTLFFIARVLQGMGLCFITVAGYACLHELFNQKEAVKNIAWISSTAIASPIIGPTLGSFVLIFAGWKYIFVFTFLTALIAVIGLYFTMPETLPKEKRVTFRFSALIPAYKELLKNKAYMTLCLYGAAVQLTVLGWIGCSPILVFEYLHFDATTFGLIQIPIFLSIICGKLTLRKLIDYYSLRKLMALGYVIALLGGGIIVLFGIFSPKSILIYGIVSGMGIFCFGHGILNVVVTRLILESTDKLKGVASGFNSFVLMVLATFDLFIASFFPLYNPAIFAIFVCFPLGLSLFIFRIITKSRRVSVH